MRITLLKITDLRCLASVEIEPHQQLNVIVGDNASGKTSLLESVYLAGRGDSFRNSGAQDLIRRGASELTIFARLSSDSGADSKIGLRRTPKATEIRVNGEGGSASDLVSTLAVQVLDPTIHRLLEDGPGHRRRFLDWGVFHVEHSFLNAWRRYQRALKQRNRAIKQALDASLVTAWNPELVETAELIDAQRTAYVEELKTYLPETLQRLGAEAGLSITYRRGWSDEADYATHLTANLSRDLRMGHTHSGPHRADLVIESGSSALKDSASRGQQKLVTAGLMLAQARLLNARTGRQAILLFDDVAAELGAGYRSTLLDEIRAAPAQCFVTALDSASIGGADEPLTSGPDLAMFHVEHGEIWQA